MKKRAATTTRARTKAKKPAKTAQFLYKTNCGTCRKARTFMTRRGFRLRFRDIFKNPLSAAEIEKLIGRREHTEFLNKRSGVYRRENMKDEPPTRREAIRLMSREPDLVRRPIVLVGGRVVLGFDESGRVRF